MSASRRRSSDVNLKETLPTQRVSRDLTDPFGPAIIVRTGTASPITFNPSLLGVEDKRPAVRAASSSRVACEIVDAAWASKPCQATRYNEVSMKIALGQINTTV